MPLEGNHGDDDRHAKVGMQTLVVVAAKNYDVGQSRTAEWNVLDYEVWVAIHVMTGEDTVQTWRIGGLVKR